MTKTFIIAHSDAHGATSWILAKNKWGLPGICAHPVTNYPNLVHITSQVLNSKKYNKIIFLDYCYQSPIPEKAIRQHYGVEFELYDHHIDLVPYAKRIYDESKNKWFIVYKTSSAPLPKNAKLNLYSSALNMNYALMPSKKKHWKTIAIVGALCDRDPLTIRYVPKYKKIADGLDNVLRLYHGSNFALQLLENGLFNVLEQYATTWVKNLNIENDYTVAGDFAVFSRSRKRRLPVNYTNKVLEYLLEKTGCKYSIGYQLYGKDMWSIMVKKYWINSEPFPADFLNKLYDVIKPSEQKHPAALAQKDRDTLVMWQPTKEKAIELINKITEF